MKIAPYILTACLVVLAVCAAYCLGRTHGQPPQTTGRYTFAYIPDGGGFARLDTATGHIELFVPHKGELIQLEITNRSAKSPMTFTVVSEEEAEALHQSKKTSQDP
jgi:hypothetical protein